MARSTPVKQESWINRLTARRVPQAVGVYLVCCLVVLELTMLASRAWSFPADWIGYLGLAVLGGIPLVVLLALFRTRR